MIHRFRRLRRLGIKLLNLRMTGHLSELLHPCMPPRGMGILSMTLAKTLTEPWPPAGSLFTCDHLCGMIESSSQMSGEVPPTMKAVVMAGGEGSRLRPLTIGRPKPMVPIANKPVMAHILDLLKRHGITEVVVTLQYMADYVQDYFGDGQSLGMKITYSVEEIPLGTAGSVKNAREQLDDAFLIISGDALTDFDLTAILSYHKSKRALATITL